MAGLGAIASILSTVVSAVGTIAGAEAQQRQADAQARQLEFEAKVEEKRAMEERAVAQRKSMQQRREGKLALSRLQARSAASGAGASDPTIISLAGSKAGETEYDALLTTSLGENRARGHEDQAALKYYAASEAREAASMKADAAFFQAGGSILGGALSAFGKFGSPLTAPPAQQDNDLWRVRDDYWKQAYA